MRKLWIACFLVLCLAGFAQAASVTIAWDAPTTNEDASPLTDLDGYNIYRCTGSACTPSALLVNVGLVVSYQDTTISLQTTYRYLIKAVDTSSNEGAASNIIEIGPPPTPTGVTAQ